MLHTARIGRFPRRGGGRLLFGLGHQHPVLLVIVILVGIAVAIALSRRR